MPDDKSEKTESTEPMVDIDDSGPEVDVKLPEPTVTEVEKDQKETEVKVDEKTTEDSAKPDDTAAKSSEQLDVRTDTDNQDQSKAQDEKLEQYSESVQKRISKLTKKWRQAEREKDSALEYAKAVENKRKQWESKYDKLDAAYVKDSEDRIKSQMESVKAELASAIESSDTMKQVEAQAKLTALTTDASRIANEKARRTEYEARMKESPRVPADDGGYMAKTTPQALPQPDAKAEAWADKNEWFGKDKAMTFTAFEYHKDMVEKEGYDPSTDEYYVEIDRRIRVDFPHKFGKSETTNSTKPEQTVASVTRGRKTSRPGTVRLTASQVAIARKLNVPLEEYAKQLKNVKEA